MAAAVPDTITITLDVEQVNQILTEIENLKLRVAGIEGHILRRPVEPISDAILDAAIIAREAAVTPPSEESEIEPAPEPDVDEVSE